MDYISYIRSKIGHEKLILNAAACIIVQDGKILLQRRSDNGKWGLIGGCMEMNETIKECALREAKEETGLDIKLDYFIGNYHNYNMEWPSKDKAHIICFVFKASIVSGTLTLDEESLELKFFDFDKLPEIAAVDHQLAIKDFLNNSIDNIN